MTLQDLDINESITLEIEWNDNSYEIPTKVVAKSDFGVLVAPFVYNDSLIELNSSRNRSMTFHLYGIDKVSQTRKVWKNVSLETTRHMNLPVYLVRVNGFHSFGSQSERRQKKRIPLNCQAAIYPASGYTRFIGRMHDISDGGLSFTIPKGMPSDFDGAVTVVFDDNVRDHPFSIRVTCSVVHKRSLIDEYLIGCSYSYTDKNLLAYICLKRAEYEANRNLEA